MIYKNQKNIITIEVAQELLQHGDLNRLVGDVDHMSDKLADGILKTLYSDDEITTLGHLLPELLELARLKQIGKHHHSCNLGLLQLQINTWRFSLTNLNVI